MFYIFVNLLTSNWFAYTSLCLHAGYKTRLMSRHVSCHVNAVGIIFAHRIALIVFQCANYRPCFRLQTHSWLEVNNRAWPKFEVTQIPCMSIRKLLQEILVSSSSFAGWIFLTRGWSHLICNFVLRRLGHIKFIF